MQVAWSSSGLEDIKLAIQQLTMRSHTSTSTYSSLSGSESSEPAVRRLMRHSSLETINTNVTSADEFVWVDSHNRLVELQQLPWTHHDVLRVLQNGRTRDHMDQVTMETIPRLSYLLQRALVRIARETQRLAKPLGLCSKHEVYSAFKIVLCPALADSCTKVVALLYIFRKVIQAELCDMFFSTLNKVAGVVDIFSALFNKLIRNRQNENFNLYIRSRLYLHVPKFIRITITNSLCAITK